MNKFYIFIFLFLISSQAFAQSFVPVTTAPWYNPETEEGVLQCNSQSAPFPIDWDQDGDLDLLTGSTTEICFFQNQGDDTFFRYPGDFGDIGAGFPHVLDWNGDGYYDIMSGSGSQIDYYENTGNEDVWLGGNEFTETADFLTFTGFSGKPAIIDWDEDGDLDFVVGELDGTLNFFENTDVDHVGPWVSGDFAAPVENWMSIDVGGYVSPTFGDLNEDGDEDLFLGQSIDEFDFYANDGAFSFETAVENYAGLENGDGGIINAPRLIDWNNDGHLDIINGRGDGHIELYLNDYDEDTYVGSDDCNNEDATINIAAEELCDSIDNDCDGETDEDNTSDGTTYYADTDEDGFGDADVSIITCDATAPSGYATDNTDCDDNAAAANSDGTEVCDELDNNCNGDVDESTAIDVNTWYQDSDGDGFGNASVAATSCNAPTDFIIADAANPDCDDTDASLTTDCPAVGDDDDDDDGTADAAASSSGCALQSSTTQNNSQVLWEISLNALALLALWRRKKPTIQSQSPNL